MLSLLFQHLSQQVSSSSQEKKHIVSLKKGSYESFTYLYNKYVGALYTFIFEIINDKDTTKDIVQETFIKVWTGKEDVNEDLVFRNYIFTIGRNLLLNELRKKVNQTLSIDTLLEDDFEVYTPGTDEEYNLNRLEKIRIAKEKLPPRQLELFVLNKEKGLSVKEIIQITNLSEQTIRNQIHQAVKFIRKTISQTLFSIFL